MSLWDPYVKAFRWASDRIGSQGVVCLVSNNSFLDDLPFDKMRGDLSNEFTDIYLIDLGGNVRKNSKLSGTTHNVFGIQVGVTISLLIRRKLDASQKKPATIRYVRMPELDRKTVKLDRLNGWKSLADIPWTQLVPDVRNRWLHEAQDDVYHSLIPMCVKRSAGAAAQSRSIFASLSNGVKSNNDAYAYSFHKNQLMARAEAMVIAFNEERDRWRMARRPKDLKKFLKKNLAVIKWIRRSKKALQQDVPLSKSDIDLRDSLYRPFTRMTLNLTKIFNEDVYSQPKYFPAADGTHGNTLIIITTHSQVPFSVQASDRIPCVDVGGRPSQSVPFYTYSEDGTKRRENITDWALAEYRAHYKDEKITKWDIFHATYAVLHHPEYRARYAANLKRDLPHIPFVPDLDTFAVAGKLLMELHINYENQPEYRLEQVEDPKAEISFRVERMKLNPKDRSELRYNDFLTLRGIPPGTFDYKLGNRSALEWIIDQYRVSTDSRSGIVNDPNREDDPKYILRLIGQVITVSIETGKIIQELPPLNLEK
jgi:predicted helicase